MKLLLILMSSWRSQSSIQVSKIQSVGLFRSFSDQILNKFDF